MIIQSPLAPPPYTKNMSLGALISPAPTPRPLQAPAPRPDNPLAAVAGTPAAGPREQGFRDILRNPAVLAFLAQSAASMLGQRGIGPGFADGAAAAGRASSSLVQQQEAQAQRDREQKQLDLDNARADTRLDLEKQRLDLARESARKGGGGGGSSAAGGIKEKDLYDDLLKIEQDRYEKEMEVWTMNNGQGPAPIPPNPLLVRRKMETISSLTPEQQEEYYTYLATDPAKADRYLDWVRKGSPSAPPVIPAVDAPNVTPPKTRGVPAPVADTSSTPARRAPQTSTPRGSQSPASPGRGGLRNNG